MQRGNGCQKAKAKAAGLSGWNFSSAEDVERQRGDSLEPINFGRRWDEVI